MKIYLARNNVQAGPYTLDELNTMLSSGEVLLDDLMWHSGMSGWVQVGQMTGGRTFYVPVSLQTPPTAPTADTQVRRGFGDNVDFRPEPEPARTSVDRLYGRTHAPLSTPVALNKSKDQPKIEYASILARFGAFAINTGLFLLAILPLMVAFMQVVDVNELSKHADNYAQMQAHIEQLVTKIPATTVAMSNIMLLALIGIQFLLIIMRGQSFGKMVMGIRVVDEKTHKLPKLGTLLFIRTCFLVMVYVIGMTFMSGLPALVMLIANYLIAKNSPTMQGWHDRLGKTLVVKAQPIQLDKTKSS